MTRRFQQPPDHREAARRAAGKGKVSHSHFRSQGAGCLINNYAPRQQQEAAE